MGTCLLIRGFFFRKRQKFVIGATSGRDNASFEPENALKRRKPHLSILSEKTFDLKFDGSEAHYTTLLV